MPQHIAQFALIVEDYDDAIDFYTKKLNFKLIEDSQISATKRWVRIAPPGSEDSNCHILLAKAVGELQKNAIGNQSGGRVFLFLHTDDFERDYENLIKHNIKIFRDRSIESFGKVVVFEDLYGNLWDLIEPSKNHE